MRVSEWWQNWAFHTKIYSMQVCSWFKPCWHTIEEAVVLFCCINHHSITSSSCFGWLHYKHVCMFLVQSPTLASSSACTVYRLCVSFLVRDNGNYRSVSLTADRRTLRTAVGVNRRREREVKPNAGCCVKQTADVSADVSRTAGSGFHIELVWIPHTCIRELNFGWSEMHNCLLCCVNCTAGFSLYLHKLLSSPPPRRSMASKE